MKWANILKKDETNYGQIVKPFRQWARECRAKGEAFLGLELMLMLLYEN